MSHRLDSLLRPRSVAVVGASARKDSMGEWSLKNLERGGYTGKIYPVNPGYDDLRGLSCYPDLASLPEVPDLVVFAVGDHRLEQSLDDAIDKKIPAAVLMSSLVLDDDAEPLLRDRVQRKIAAAGMLVCGANGMGFYNIRDKVWACGFDSRLHEGPGNASLISHSGSGMSGIVDCEQRLQFNFAVSAGNEIAVTMDQYLDFALDLPETRVVGLFVETARNPEGFRNALAKAARKRIPIVALKVGKTARAAALTISHSGAMAGDDATYAALFDYYGVHRVADMDELATAMIVFAAMNPIGPGGLATLHDSGGERQLIVDLADETGVPLPELTVETTHRLQSVLDPELPAVNPLDGWSRGGPGARQQMSDCMSILLQDEGIAVGAVMHDRAPEGRVYPSYIRYMEAAHEKSGKPVALVAARQGTGHDSAVVAATHRGFPVLDGVLPFLKSIRLLMNQRDYVSPTSSTIAEANPAAIKVWPRRLRANGVLDEADSLQLLRDFGLPTSRGAIAGSEAELIDATKSLRKPLVLKTATPGMMHKSDHGGVRLGLETIGDLQRAYQDLAERLGPSVLVAEMAPAGVEMILGARRDPQFGPVVIMGFGGTLAEVLSDVAFALPPFDAHYAMRRLSTLRLRPLLDGVRGKPAADIRSFCEMAARFSVMVHALGDELQEVDVNPVIVGSQASVAVDALVVAHSSAC